MHNFMKKNKISKYMAVALLTGAPLLWSACTDTWDSHYDVNNGGMADQPSLLQNIQKDPDLANFARVIKEIGAEDLLNSPQQLTIWAPVGLTSDQADSIIAVYKKDVEEGLKQEDNKAITQFLQNHISLYTQSLSSLTNDTIKMLNKKYMWMKGVNSTTGTLSAISGADENKIVDVVLCNNGLLYKTENKQNFFPNVREYVDQSKKVLDSLSNFIKFFDEYELDEKASVAGGIVDGKTVYLDSVTTLTNDILSHYGFIQREDSVYTMIAPTNKVWEDLYKKYSTYYNYNPNVNKYDSLADANVKRRIIEGRFFNTSRDWRYNRDYVMGNKDSICNTMYVERQKHNPRQNVYYDPENTIFAGLKRIECSNGFIYVDDKGTISSESTFFGRKDVEAYYASYYEIPRNSSNEETMNVSTRIYQAPYRYTTDENGDVQVDEWKEYQYVQVTPKTGKDVNLEYTLPNVLSGCYYNIYVVTVPNVNNNLPCWFRVSNRIMKADGKFPTSETYYNNPHPITADTEGVDNVNVILKQSNNNRCYVASATKVDTILIQKAVQFPYSSVGLEEGTVKLKFLHFGPSSSADKIYTRTLSLNEIILVPFETEKEAEEAADDLDAFNDDLLEANRKK